MKRLDTNAELETHALDWALVGQGGVLTQLCGVCKDVYSKIRA